MFAHEIKETASVIPLIAVLIPALTAVLVAFVGDQNERVRDRAALLGAFLSFGVVLYIASEAFGGRLLYLNTGVGGTGELALSFFVDPMGALFALIASVLWVLALIHAKSYMYHENKRTRFFTVVMVTEAATLGVFLVGDFFSLFVFFEIMGLAAYFLIVHQETWAARLAGTKYIYMAVIGGLGLLMGIFLYFYHAGTLSFVPLENSGFLQLPLKVFAFGFLIAGFGVKAGMLPLHTWLPDAHPAAPSPASALLSGVMIKAGAYGILRSVLSFFHANGSNLHGEMALNVSHMVEAVARGQAGLASSVRASGFAIIWIAIITMFSGMLLAVFQRNIKRTLAYSSVSQMGFVLLGVGCLAYLGEEGAVGLAGGIYHVLNHALFKGSLFLVAGSILYRTHELNMYRLGGLYRKMPVSTAIWCVAALGIMGIPLFNGFASKSLLHHAIVEAGHLAENGFHTDVFWLGLAEKIFVITSGGTVLYFLKMTYLTFFRTPPQSGGSTHHNIEIREAPIWMLVGSGGLALGVIIIGLVPELVLGHAIVPVMESFAGLDAHAVEHLAEVKILAWGNVVDVFPPLVLGTGAFAAGLMFKLFRPRERKHPLVPIPRWLSFDYCYITGASWAISSCFTSHNACHRLQNTIAHDCSSGFAFFCSIVGVLKNLKNRVVLQTFVLSCSIIGALKNLQRRVVEQTKETLQGVSKANRRYALLIKASTVDISLGALAIAALLALVLFIVFTRGT